MDYDYIAIDPHWAPEEKQELNETTQKMVRKFFESMKARGVTAVRVEFSGEGDSGNINEVYFTGLHGDEVDLEKLAPVPDLNITTQNGSTYDQAKQAWVPNIEQFAPANLKEFAEEVGNQVACAPGYDWWNNDGGAGHVIFYHDDNGDHIQLMVGEHQKTTTEHNIAVVF